jgi:two-component system, LytTR family, response regulator
MITKIRCLAVDDESLARKMLEDYILQIPFLELVKTCKNAIEAQEIMHSEKIDLLFLDIQMPGMLGTQFLETLQIKPMVIFVTAYDQYAVESYQLEVIDYLLKPVGFDRFYKAALKAQESFKKNQISGGHEVAPLSYMFINVEYSLVRVSFDHISHIEGLKDYIKIYVNHAVHPILTKSTLKGIEEKLPSRRFMRVQKSFIVNLDKIESIRNHRITIGKYEIPVSDAHMESLLEAINYTK